MFKLTPTYFTNLQQCREGGREWPIYPPTTYQLGMTFLIPFAQNMRIIFFKNLIGHELQHSNYCHCLKIIKLWQKFETLHSSHNKYSRHLLFLFSNKLWKYEWNLCLLIKVSGCNIFSMTKFARVSGFASNQTRILLAHFMSIFYYIRHQILINSDECFKNL